MSYSASLMLALDWERKREVCDDDSPVSPSARISISVCMSAMYPLPLSIWS